MDTDTVTQLASELAQVQARKKELEEREEYLKDTLRKLGEGKHGAGALTVVVSPPNRALDEAKVKEALPITEFPHFYVQKPNSAVIKASIAPLLYESLMSIPAGAKLKVSVK